MNLGPSRFIWRFNESRDSCHALLAVDGVIVCWDFLGSMVRMAWKFWVEFIFYALDMEVYIKHWAEDMMFDI